MGNRIIKESICTSDNIDRLTAFEETFFYRLIVNCDDYGCMDARPKILAARLFPLKSVGEAEVEDILLALEDAELIVRYRVNGRPYLQMMTWDRHQQTRAKRRKYPGPDEADEVSSDDGCNHVISDDINCNQMIPSRARAESESESNPNPNPNPKKARGDDPAFETFWAEYPKKVKKPNAQRVWASLKPEAELVARIMQGLARWKQSDQWTRDDGRFIPHPATWLNNRQWEDEVQTRKAAKSPAAQSYGQREYSSEYWAEYERQQQEEMERAIAEMRVAEVRTG